MCCVCVSVCLDVNHDGTNRNRYTQSLVILRAQHRPTNEPSSETNKYLNYAKETARARSTVLRVGQFEAKF